LYRCIFFLLLSHTMIIPFEKGKLELSERESNVSVLRAVQKLLSTSRRKKSIDIYEGEEKKSRQKLLFHRHQMNSCHVNHYKMSSVNVAGRLFINLIIPNTFWVFYRVVHKWCQGIKTIELKYFAIALLKAYILFHRFRPG
jgi:hypothetical protein